MQDTNIRYNNQELNCYQSNLRHSIQAILHNNEVAHPKLPMLKVKGLLLFIRCQLLVSIAVFTFHNQMFHSTFHKALSLLETH